MPNTVRGTRLNTHNSCSVPRNGWWQSYADAVPGWFELYVGLEAAASRLRTYAPELVPGLLRAEAYVVEVLRASRPGVTDAETRRAVVVNGHRRAILARRNRPPPRLEVLLSEAALRRPLHDRNAMADQLRRLAAVPNAAATPSGSCHWPPVRSRRPGPAPPSPS